MVEDAQERAQKVLAAFEPLEQTITLLERNHLPVLIVSGGGTGTYDMTGTLPFVTELQCGSYVFMDSTYSGIRDEFEPTLTLLSTVVSRPIPERIVVDAGMKSMTKEFGWPQPLSEGGISVRYLSEEHGVLDLTDPQELAHEPGDRMRFLPSHCCTTINLHDRLHVVQGKSVVDVWPIAARGCAQ
jgi:D-serine deaminase-like pyridoxal phosphate-dependent protein